MKLIRLELEHFRNYKEPASISFDQFSNVLVGLNAQGKTNLLEALYMLAHSKSYRVQKNSELITFGEETAKVSLIAENRLGKNNISIIIKNDNTKFIYINGKRLKKATDLLGYLTVVLFSPDDLSIITGSPTERRRFIDRFISQVKTSYANLLNDYYKVLKNRNQTLKDISDGKADKSLLQVWDEQLASFAASITGKRQESLKTLEQYANMFYSTITGDKEKLTLEYCISSTNKPQQQNLQEYYANRLISSYRRDLAYGLTSVGPHREDISIFINNKDARMYASQGQKRLITLCLKYAEVEYIKDKTQEYPVLLFDDVLLELDLKRKHNLLVEMVKKAQIVIATTDLKRYQEIILEQSSIFTVQNGTIQQGMKI